MKKLMCNQCGDLRLSGKECPSCGGEELNLKQTEVSDLINSRSEAELKCGSCGEDLFDEDVDAYQHSGGWNVPGLPVKMWLSIECPKCRYDTSFCKFGIDK